MEQQSKTSTRWQQSEDELLLNAILTGSMTTVEIASELGRSQKAVWARTKHLKLAGLLDDRKYVARKMANVTAWTPEQDEQLIEAYATDYLTVEQIGALMGRSLGSVRCRLAVLRQRGWFSDSAKGGGNSVV